MNLIKIIIVVIAFASSSYNCAKRTFDDEKKYCLIKSLVFKDEFLYSSFSDRHSSTGKVLVKAPNSAAKGLFLDQFLWILRPVSNDGSVLIQSSESNLFLCSTHKKTGILDAKRVVQLKALNDEPDEKCVWKVDEIDSKKMIRNAHYKEILYPATSFMESYASKGRDVFTWSKKSDKLATKLFGPDGDQFLWIFSCSKTPIYTHKRTRTN